MVTIRTCIGIKKPEPITKSTSQVVRQGCQQVVSEVVSQPDAAKAPTKAPQPPAPFRPLPIIRVGDSEALLQADRYRYCHKEGAMAVTCRGKELEVLNTRVNDQGEQEAEVKASGWCTSYWVLSCSLKKVR